MNAIRFFFSGVGFDIIKSDSESESAGEIHFSIFPDPSVKILVEGALQHCLRKTRGVHVSPAGRGIINDDISKTFTGSFEKSTFTACQFALYLVCSYFLISDIKMQNTRTIRQMHC